MKSRRSSRYSGYRFPSEIISDAIWAYHRFCISFRDVEDLLAERGILVSYETIRLWCQKFGADYVRKLRRLQGRLGDHWHLDEVFLRINGQPAVSLARDRSGRRRNRHSGAAATRSTCRRAVLSQASTRARTRAVVHHHRPTEK